MLPLCKYELFPKLELFILYCSSLVLLSEELSALEYTRLSEFQTILTELRIFPFTKLRYFY